MISGWMFSEGYVSVPRSRLSAGDRSEIKIISKMFSLTHPSSNWMASRFSSSGPASPDEQERVVVLSRKSPFRYLYSPSVQR